MPVPIRFASARFRSKTVDPIGAERGDEPVALPRSASWSSADRLFLRQPHDRADRMVRVAKRHAFQDQIVREIGGEQRGIRHRRRATLPIHRRSRRAFPPAHRRTSAV